MSIDNDTNSRSRVLMLAMMMVASSFAVIGNSAAGPNGTESVMWDATNGYMHTDADGSMVYAYAGVADVDMNFTASGLAIAEDYLLSIELWRVDWSLEPDPYTHLSTLNSTFTGVDDGDGNADDVTEFLSLAGMSSDRCYDTVAILYYEDAAGDLMELASIAQLISTGDGSVANETACEGGMTGTMEWASVTHPGSTPGVSGFPHFADVASVSVHVGAYDLDDTVSYYFAYELDEYLIDGSEGGTTSGQNIDGANGNHSEDISHLLWADGCYIISAYLFDDTATYMITAHYGEMFTVGSESACDDIGGGPSPDGPEIYVWTDDGYYQTGEEIIAHIAADYLDNTLSYNVEWSLYIDDSASGEWIELITSGYSIDVGHDFHIQNETLSPPSAWNISDEGCYEIEAELFDSDNTNMLFNDWYVFIIDDPSTETPHCDDSEGEDSAYIIADHPFNPDMGMMDFYLPGEDVIVSFGAWDLEPESTYASYLLIFDLWGSEGSFTCDDGEEIPAEWVNDGEEDCADGSDEDGDAETFTCDDGTEIPADLVNDGVEDCADGSDEGVDEGVEVFVDIVGSAFNPDTITIAVGDTVTWTNSDGFSHTVTHDDDAIDSGELANGETFSITFTTPGTFSYHCGIHGSSMSGTVIVEGDAGTGGGEMDGLTEFLDSALWQSDVISITTDTEGEYDGNATIGEEIIGDNLDGGAYGLAYMVVTAVSADSGEIEDIEMGFSLICYENSSGDCPMPPDECPFDDNNPDNPCYAVEQCDPFSAAYDEDACEQAVMDYCAANPDDPGCDMGQGECPFDEGNADSPCYVEACDPNSPNHDQAVCEYAVQNYCANNPDDGGCDMGPEFDFESYLTGGASYEMYFEHFDYWDDDDETFGANNGLLELVSTRELSYEIRGFIDGMPGLGDGDGIVDIYEAEAFAAMMNEGPDGEMGQGECPFDESNADSPCYVEACDPNSPNHDQAACDQAVQNYCADNPDDEACGDGEPPETKTPEGEEQGDDDDGHLVVELDGALIGEPHHRWVWIDNLWGPVDGSDNLPLTFTDGMIWELDLGSWMGADIHTIVLSDDAGDLIDPCGDGEALSGSIQVHDSYSWTPEEPALPSGWTDMDAENGYKATFDCNSDPLTTLTVVYTKTIEDYNGDNFDDDDYGGAGDVDMSSNLPPECNLYATIEAGGDMTDAEHSFTAPDGNHTIDLDPGHYFLYAGCMDPDGDMVTATLATALGSLEFLEEGSGEVAYEFTLLAGMPDISIAYEWASAGGHSGMGTITVHVNDVPAGNTTTDDPIIHDDGTVTCPAPLVLEETTNADGTTDYECVTPSADDIGDIIDEDGDGGGGILPGFSTLLSVMSMLGAVFVLGRRRQNL